MPLTQAVTAATTALNQRDLRVAVRRSDSQGEGRRLIAAELAVANARVQVLSRLQASAARLSGDQIQALRAGWRPGRRQRRCAAAATEPLDTRAASGSDPRWPVSVVG